MTRIWLNSSLCSVVAALVFTSSGCFPRATVDQEYYIIEAARPGEPATVRSDVALRLQRFGVDAAFATKQLIYRIGEFRYESDYYNQFLVSPEVMLMTETRDWLEDSGLFARVGAADGRLAPAYVLTGNIKALYADFTNKSAPEAVVEIRFFLFEGADAEGSVIVAQTYRATSPICARTAGAVVEGLSRSLQEILTRLEGDLAKVLARQAAQEG